LTILQIEKALARKRLAPYLVIKKNDRSSWGTVRRSFFLAFFIACGDFFISFLKITTALTPLLLLFPKKLTLFGDPDIYFIFV
jgi:hypothetical protein